MDLIRRAAVYGGSVTVALVALQVALLLLPTDDGGATRMSPLSPATGEVVMGLVSVVALFVLCTAVAWVLLLVRRRDGRAR